MNETMSISVEQQNRVLDDYTTLISMYGIPMPAQKAVTVIIRKVAQAICNYCNINSVPKMLENVWVDMCIDYLRYLNAVRSELDPNTDNTGQSKTPTYISSINELSVSVAYGKDDTSEQNTAKQAHDISTGLDGIVMNYTDQLNRYRRMTW